MSNKCPDCGTPMKHKETQEFNGLVYRTFECPECGKKQTIETAN